MPNSTMPRLLEAYADIGSDSSPQEREEAKRQPPEISLLGNILQGGYERFQGRTVGHMAGVLPGGSLVRVGIDGCKVGCLLAHWVLPLVDLPASASIAELKVHLGARSATVLCQVDRHMGPIGLLLDYDWCHNVRATANFPSYAIAVQDDDPSNDTHEVECKALHKVTLQGRCATFVPVTVCGDTSEALDGDVVIEKV